MAVDIRGARTTKRGTTKAEKRQPRVEVQNGM